MTGQLTRMANGDLSPGSARRILEVFQRRRYLVFPDHRLDKARVVIRDVVKSYCLSRGWPLVEARRRTWRGSSKADINFDLPSHKWLSPEGHKSVNDFLRTIFTSREPYSEEGIRITGPFSTTRNSDPFPYHYSQCCKLRDLHEAATGLFNLALRHMTPDTATIDPLLFWA